MLNIVILLYITLIVLGGVGWVLGGCRNDEQ